MDNYCWCRSMSKIEAGCHYCSNSTKCMDVGMSAEMKKELENIREEEKLKIQKYQSLLILNGLRGQNNG